MPPPGPVVLRKSFQLSEAEISEKSPGTPVCPSLKSQTVFLTVASLPCTKASLFCFPFLDHSTALHSTHCFLDISVTLLLVTRCPAKAAQRSKGLFWLTVRGCAVHHSGESRQQQCRQLAHNVPAVRKQREGRCCSALFLIIQSRSPAHKVVLPTLRVSFPTSTKPT